MYINHLIRGGFFVLIGFGKSLKMDIVCIWYIPIVSGLIPKLWDGLWEFHNRFNDLLIIQFYIIKPMQFHEFDVFVFECSFLSVEIKNSLHPTIP